MKPSFLRSHVAAWIAGVVFAYLSAFVFVMLAAPNLVLWHPSPGLLPLLISSVVALLFIWRLAVLLGRYDLLAVLPGGLAVVLSFAVSYSMSIPLFLPDDGHTMFDVLAFGARPFDFFGQFRIFAFLFVWAACIVCGGIALKRWREVRIRATREPAGSLVLSNRDLSKMALWLAFDLGLIACVTFAILRAQVLNRIAEGRPENICLAAVQVLQSKTSTRGELANAVFKLGRVQSETATDLLRHAAREQPEPVNLAAAAELLGRDDLTGLSVLENTMMHLSHLEANYGATNTSSLGLSSSVTGFGFQMNVGSCLGRVKDPAAVPILVHLMSSPDFDTRRGAAHALRTIASPASTDALVKALDDSDTQVRYFATCGLIEIAGDGHYPSEGRFAVNEAVYLDQWKTWAKQRASTGTSP